MILPYVWIYTYTICTFGTFEKKKAETLVKVYAPAALGGVLLHCSPWPTSLEMFSRIEPEFAIGLTAKVYII